MDHVKIDPLAYDGPDGIWKIRQQSCCYWFCEKKKQTPEGLCQNCLRFGKNTFSDRIYGKDLNNE